MKVITKIKDRLQRIFCKDLLDRIEKLEGTVKHITDERDDLSNKLEAAELAYNLLWSEYNNFKKNPGNTRPAKVPHKVEPLRSGALSEFDKATEAIARNASTAFTSAADALKVFSEEASET